MEENKFLDEEIWTDKCWPNVSSPQEFLEQAVKKLKKEEEENDNNKVTKR